MISLSSCTSGPGIERNAGCLEHVRRLDQCGCAAVGARLPAQSCRRFAGHPDRQRLGPVECMVSLADRAWPRCHSHVHALAVADCGGSAGATPFGEAQPDGARRTAACELAHAGGARACLVGTARCIAIGPDCTRTRQAGRDPRAAGGPGLFPARHLEPAHAGLDAGCRAGSDQHRIAAGSSIHSQTHIAGTRRCIGRDRDLACVLSHGFRRRIGRLAQSTFAG